MAYVQFYENLPTGIRLQDLFIYLSSNIGYAADITPQLATFSIYVRNTSLQIVYSGNSIGADHGNVSSISFGTGARSWITYGAATDMDTKFSYASGLTVFQQSGIAAASVAMAGDDVLMGSSKGDYMESYSGNDALYGGRGEDTLVGGVGDDTYYVDNKEDRAIEARLGGYDTLITSVSFALAAGSEIERLQAVAGSSKLSLDGNGFANLIIGNSGANTLNGGGGVDTLDGGRGNDTYLITNKNDVIIEVAGGGSDTVLTGVSYALSDGVAVESLTAGGKASIILTGNSLSNTITGNVGNNRLNGLGGNDKIYGNHGNDRINGGMGNDKLYGGHGNDILQGGNGNDVLYGDIGNDRLNGDAGNDTLYGGPDNSTLSGGTGNDRLYGSYNDDRLAGGSGKDVIYGDTGNDTIYGGLGNDILSSGEGYDNFVFDTKPDSKTNVDTILDFNPWADRITLKHSVFTAIGYGALNEGAFWIGSKAHDVSDRIIYNKDAGALYYDPDGTGSAQQVKVAIVGQIDLSQAAFFIV